MKLFSWFENKDFTSKSFSSISKKIDAINTKHNDHSSMWPIAKVKLPIVNLYSPLAQKKALPLPIPTQVALTSKIALETKSPS